MRHYRSASDRDRWCRPVPAQRTRGTIDAQEKGNYTEGGAIVGDGVRRITALMGMMTPTRPETVGVDAWADESSRYDPKIDRAIYRATGLQSFPSSLLRWERPLL